MAPRLGQGPLAGLRLVELSKGVGAAYAGRLLATLGAETVLVEPPSGNPLRREPLFLPGSSCSALFAYLAAGKQSVVCDILDPGGLEDIDLLLAKADIFICDLPVADRAPIGLDDATLRNKHPRLANVSILPFGAEGPKAGWSGEEINLIHAGGEGFLLPNGLSAELFPDRPPLKVHGYFAEMQGGVVGALGALSAVLARDRLQGQFVDVSIQDAALAVGAFAIQRLGDGSLEHRVTRSFKYGGVLECADGYVELLTLEERQWTGLVELMGSPSWATDPALSDSLERSRRGKEINAAIRAWAMSQPTLDLVARAQRLGVPMAKYASPADVLRGPHEQTRGLFQTVDAPGFGPCPTLVAPFQFAGIPLSLLGGAPALGQHQALIERGTVAHSKAQAGAR